jgi:hypothetical protein
MKKAIPPATDARDLLDWDHVDRRDGDTAKDVLGLSMADRRALGLSAPRAAELQSPSLVGAETALADVLARGGAIGKPPARNR